MKSNELVVTLKLNSGFVTVLRFWQRQNLTIMMTILALCSDVAVNIVSSLRRTSCLVDTTLNIQAKDSKWNHICMQQLCIMRLVDSIQIFFRFCWRNYRCRSSWLRVWYIADNFAVEECFLLLRLSLGLARKTSDFFSLFNLRLWQSEGLCIHFSNKLPFNRSCELRALYQGYNPKFQRLL